MNNKELIDLIDELRALPKENEYVEFKAGNVTTNEKIGDYISGISNAACICKQDFGYFVFGIDDVMQEVIGTKFKFKNLKESKQELELYLRSQLAPSIAFEHFICDYGEFRLEIFKIPAARAVPTYFKGKAHTRIGTSLTNLQNYPDYIRAIYNSENDWSSNIIESASINDLDSEAIAKARLKFKEKKAGSPVFDEIDKWSDATFLDKAKITINGKITNAAIILLGKNEAIHYISPAVAQITWKLSTEEKAYEHFETPFFLSVNDIARKIRNVKYKFFPDNQLIAVEVNKYDTKVILEALNNCIAHQDYSQKSRIILEEKVNKLIFSNAGRFVDGSPEDYSLGDKTPKKYRNRWLVNAMFNLNMIDSMGQGIHSMYVEQRNRFFPLPDYTNSSTENVVLEIYGQIIDENYSKLLIEKKDALSLTEVILLDKVQKNQEITEDAVKLLKKKCLIEGRKPNYYISAEIAEITDQKALYTKNKGLNKEFYKELILQHIKNHGFSTREEINELLLDKFPTYMSEVQRKTKIHNLMSEMTDKIQNEGNKAKPRWVLVKSV